jgi:rubrerythrin
MTTSDLDFFSASAQLAACTELDIEAMELLYRLEISGDDFYQALADRIGNDEAGDLLRKNGREELGHARRVQRAMSIKLGREYEPSPEVSTPFSIPLPDEVSLKLFPAIVKAELDGDAGYQHWADIEPDPEIARLLRLNGREETIHGERVAQALSILEAAQAS